MMLDASEANSIFMLLLQSTPELVAEHQRGAFHAKLSSYLGTATTMRVAQLPDRLQFVVLSLTCGANFYQHPDLDSTWIAVREQGASLAELMKSWSDELWATIERKQESLQ